MRPRASWHDLVRPKFQTPFEILCSSSHFPLSLHNLYYPILSQSYLRLHLLNAGNKRGGPKGAEGSLEIIGGSCGSLWKTRMGDVKKLRKDMRITALPLRRKNKIATIRTWCITHVPRPRCGMVQPAADPTKPGQTFPQALF